MILANTLHQLTNRKIQQSCECTHLFYIHVNSLTEVIFFHYARPKKRKGYCKTPPICRNGMIYWSQDSKCYTLHTKGPCPKGKLFVMGKNRLAECKVRMCAYSREASAFILAPNQAAVIFENSFLTNISYFQFLV